MILAFDGLQDPGNLGTLVRTAAWFNAAGLFLGLGTTELYQPKVVRSTAGATGMLAAAEGDLAAMLDEAASAGRPIFILDGGENSVPLESIRFPTNSVIVVGNEGRGVSSSILNLPYPKVRISGNASNVESLNAAVAASIALHHVFTHPSH
jgi:TrmH family RNA methyltransferase